MSDAVFLSPLDVRHYFCGRTCRSFLSSRVCLMFVVAFEGILVVMGLLDVRKLMSDAAFLNPFGVHHPL